MPETESIAAVVGEWVKKAENDLRSAQVLLGEKDDHLADIICFHAQQCVEKYFKALLVRHQIPFPKTHGLSGLVNLLPVEYHDILSTDEQQLMTKYATITRYPGDYEEISLSDAHGAVKTAARVRKIVRSLLPKGALRRVGGKNKQGARNK
jgi:HEPN domain-containing protein